MRSVALALAIFAGPMMSLAATPVPTAVKRTTTPSSSFHVNPDTIRTRVVEANTSVLESLNQVYQAKESVNEYRAALLPELDASALLSGGVFSLSAVSTLLPFLLPSNWYNLDVQKNQLAADGIAFYLVKLNTYASADSLHSTLLSDQGLYSVYQQNATYLQQIQDVVQAKAELGLANPTDLAQARSRAQLAHAQVAEIQAMIAQENASMRKLLNFTLNTNLVYDQIHPAAIAAETQSPKDVLSQVLKKSPELQQYDSLMAAGRSQKWSAVFGFLSGASMDKQHTDKGWGPLTGSGKLKLSFGEFPEVRLDQLAIQYLQIQKEDAALEEQRIVETTLSAVAFAKQRLSWAQQSEDNANKEFDAYMEQYRLGLTDLLHVLNASNDVIQASVTRLSAQSELDTQRVALQRALIVGPFAPITPCRLMNAPGGGAFGWLHDIFSGKANTVSIDQVCSSSAAHANMP